MRDKMSASAKKRIRYDAGFKLKVVELALETSNMNAARHFSVNEKQVREWKKAECVLKEMPKKSKCNQKNPPNWPKLEEEVAKWMSENRQSGLLVTRAQIRLFALNWADRNEENSRCFKASNSWCTRFMNRYNHVLREKAKMAQNLLRDLDYKITSFHKFVIEHRQQHQYPLQMIGNMDETPVFFDMVGNKTLNKASEKNVWVKTTGHEKQRFTVVLACLADGTKLPPMVIFKRKTFPKKIKFPKGVTIHVQENGWMDDDGCIKWINEVWAHRPGGGVGQLTCKSLLVWDMFKSHLSENVKATIKRCNTDIAFIPCGLASVIQPLDVCLNKPFKDRLHQFWNEWMFSGDHSFIDAGSLATVCEWVVKSWESISVESVQKSFKKCGISNAMDGTEDDLLWLDDNEEDNVLFDQLITPENDPYDDHVSAEDWNLLFDTSDDEDDEFHRFS